MKLGEVRLEGWNVSVTNDEFEALYPKYESVIRAIARKVAQRNDSIIDDLCQEGALALLRLNLKKSHGNTDAYIRQAVKFRMIDWLRKQRLNQTESLTPHLENGDQVVKDEDTGEARLLIFKEHHQRQLYNEEFSEQATRRAEKLQEEG